MDTTFARTLAAEALAGIAPEADLSAVGEDEDLRDALDLDSMDFMNFVAALSKRCGVDVPASEAPGLRTLHGVAAWHARARGGR